MIDGRLLREEDFDSAVLREAADKLNFIYRLACTFRAPELLRFLSTLSSGLDERREFLQACRVSRN